MEEKNTEIAQMTDEELKKKCTDLEEKIAVLESHIREKRSFSALEILIFLLPFAILTFIIFNKLTNKSML